MSVKPIISDTQDGHGVTICSNTYSLDQQDPTSKMNTVQGNHLSRLCRKSDLQPALRRPTGNENEG